MGNNQSYSPKQLVAQNKPVAVLDTKFCRSVSTRLSLKRSKPEIFDEGGNLFLHFKTKTVGLSRKHIFRNADEDIIAEVKAFDSAEGYFIHKDGIEVAAIPLPLLLGETPVEFEITLMDKRTITFGLVGNFGGASASIYISRSGSAQDRAWVANVKQKGGILSTKYAVEIVSGVDVAFIAIFCMILDFRLQEQFAYAKDKARYPLSLTDFVR